MFSRTRTKNKKSYGPGSRESLEGKVRLKGSHSLFCPTFFAAPKRDFSKSLRTAIMSTMRDLLRGHSVGNRINCRWPRPILPFVQLLPPLRNWRSSRAEPKTGAFLHRWSKKEKRDSLPPSLFVSLLPNENGVSSRKEGVGGGPSQI